MRIILQNIISRYAKSHKKNIEIYMTKEASTASTAENKEIHGNILELETTRTSVTQSPLTSVTPAER